MLRNLSKAAGIAIMVAIIMAAYGWVVLQFVLFKFDGIQILW